MRRAFLILPLALGLVAAGCGGSSGGGTAPAARARRRHDCERLHRRRRPRRHARTAAPRLPTSASIPEKTYTLVFTTNCGSFTVTLDLAKAPATSASLVSLAKSGFFDNTDLPPDRPRLRDPGRRPDPDWKRRPGLHDGGQASRRRELREGRGRDGEERRGAARHRRQPVLRRHGRRRRPAPGLRRRRHGDERDRHRRADRQARRSRPRSSRPNPS